MGDPMAFSLGSSGAWLWIVRAERLRTHDERGKRFSGRRAVVLLVRGGEIRERACNGEEHPRCLAP